VVGLARQRSQYAHKQGGSVSFDDLSPEALAELMEFAALNQPPLNPGQIAGAEMYDRIIDVQATQQVVQANVGEVEIYNYTLGGGTLGTQGAVRLLLLGTYLNSSGSASTVELKVSYGATLMYEDISGSNASQAQRSPLNHEFIFHGTGATNAQAFHGRITGADRTTAPSTGLGPRDQQSGFFDIYGTAAENSTLNKAISIKIQHSNNSSSTSYHRNYALLTKIGH